MEAIMCELARIWAFVKRDPDNPADGDNVRVIPTRATSAGGAEISLDEALALFGLSHDPDLERPVNMRLVNIDAPEISPFYYDRDGRRIKLFGQGKYGQAAQDKLAELLPDESTVVIEIDQQTAGDHGRPLVHVWTTGDNDQPDRYINAEMAASGLVLPYIIYPNLTHAGWIRTAAAQAATQGLGFYPHLRYDPVIDPDVLAVGEVLNEPFIFRRLIDYLIDPGNRQPLDAEALAGEMRWLVDTRSNRYYPFHAYRYIKPHLRTWYPAHLDLRHFGFCPGNIELIKNGEPEPRCGESRPGLITYTPYGAAGQVTGSKHLFQIHRADRSEGVLLDCGLDHEHPASEEELTELADRTDHVVLSHAHLDHFGELDRLLRIKPSIRVFCTYGTRHIIFETARRMVGESVEPAFAGLEHCFQVQPYHRSFAISPSIRGQLWGAGHMPGSGQVALELTRPDGQKRTVLASGDLGPLHDIPILLSPDLDLPRRPDLLLCESTYGTEDRSDRTGSMLDLLAEIEHARDSGRTIICAAFSVMRTQAILYDLWRLQQAGLLPPDFRAVLDASRRSSAVTLNRYVASWLTAQLILSEPERQQLAGFPVERFDPATAWKLGGTDPFASFLSGNPGDADLTIVADGMWNFGRARQAIIAHAGKEKVIFLLAGFQAETSNGRQLQNAMASRIAAGDAATEAREIVVKEWDWDNNVVGQQQLTLRAEVRKLSAYMSHVDGPCRRRYIQRVDPKQLLLIHGDPDALTEVKADIDGQLGLENEAVIAELGTSYTV
jgi:metallo-beta-lactamase family protein